VSVGGFYAGTAGGGGASVQKNHPTSGRIPSGALIENEIPTDVFSSGALEISLREGDYTSAVRMANAINEQIGPLAHAVDSETVRIFVPPEAQAEDKRAEFIAMVENVEFRPDAPARIVMNEKTGTIVANARIRIHSVAVAHGNLTVTIASTQNVSQPQPFTGNVVGNVKAGAGGAGGSGGAAAPGQVGNPEQPLEVGGLLVYKDSSGSQIQLAPGVSPPPGYTMVMQSPTGQAGVASPGAAGAPGGNATVTTGAQTVVTQQTNTNVEEPKLKFVVLEDLPTVEQVASALNALGVTPRDMMAIFQAMKEAGALQADLVLQ
jgi:flagellar P-ring protein precursor FlgI